MPLIITDTNNYTKRFNKSILQKILKKSLTFLKLSNKEIHINFISDYRMKKLNIEYRSIYQTTDVLSFFYDDTYNNIYGEIFISLKSCEKNIKKNGNTLIKELSILCIHGFLHLLGHDHDNPEKERKMFQLQEKIYRKSK